MRPRLAIGRGILCTAAWLWLAVLLGGPSPVRAEARAEEMSRRERVYMAELALLLEGARRLLAYGEAHGESSDPELARFACPLSERYVEMANRMLPSTKLAVVHPHLLLTLENLDRALDAAAAAEVAAYQKRMRIAREELANLEAVLKQLKLRVPELPR